MNALYAAPLEGVTGYVWRQAHRAVFGGANRYYTPFLTPDSSLRFQTKELRELTQGEQADLVPQVLTNRSDCFIWAARELYAMGFSEVNLNVGCPSGTVVAKHKGSGMLREPAELCAFLEDVFSALPDARISVKTRIGIKSADEWEAIAAVFSRFPICELIVHPRVQAQFYTGAAQREVFLSAREMLPMPLVYNGDVFSPEDEAFSYGCGVMAGRGLIRDPALLRRVRGGENATRGELVRFHDLLLEGYGAYMPGDVALLHRMRELWSYMAQAFTQTEQAIKRMRKAKTLTDYRSAAESILQGCPLREAQ